LAEVGRYYDSANDPVTLQVNAGFSKKIVRKQKDRAGRPSGESRRARVQSGHSHTFRQAPWRMLESEDRS